MTPKERELRFSRLRYIGCLASLLDGRICFHAEIHHLNIGGKAGQKRRGDEFTIPICSWHHRGDPRSGYTATQMLDLFGPSLARHPRKFRERYGTDDALLARANELIRQIDGSVG